MSTELLENNVNDMISRVGRLEKNYESVSKGFQSLVDQMGGVSFGIGSVLNTVIKLTIKHGWVKDEKELENLVLKEQERMMETKPQTGDTNGSTKTIKKEQTSEHKIQVGETQGKEHEKETDTTS